MVSITIIAIAGVLTIGNNLKPATVDVELYKAKAQLVEDTVICSGKVETAENKSVFLDLPCVADQVLVEPGQMVDKGDVLFTVDYAATEQALVSAGAGFSNINVEDVLQKEVVAPLKGIVSVVNVQEGSLASNNTACVVIDSNEALQVKVAINEKNLRNIQMGQKVRVSGTAFYKESYEGKITYISPVARQQAIGTNMETVVDAVVTLDEEEIDSSLKIGLNAEAAVVVSSEPKGLVIPYAYVMQDDDEKEFVYLLKDGKAVKQIITTGKELSNGFQIVSGLSNGDQIIKNPTDIEKSGTPVHVKGS